MRKSWVREKRVLISDFQELSLFGRTAGQELAHPMPRGRRKVTQPKNQLFNDKKSAKYFYWLAQQFKRGDYLFTFTYSNEYLPETPEEAKREMKLFFERLRNRLKKIGVEMKYLMVTEYELAEEGHYSKRVHHHVLLNKEVPLEEVVDCWKKGRGRNKHQIGLVHVKLIQVLDELRGFEELVQYMTKGLRHKKGERLWARSRNLELPVETKHDRKYSFRQLEKLANRNDGLEQLAKLYPEWDIFDFRAFYLEYDGWHINAKMRKRR